jgi:glycolate oxidase iron-sulfur subunit
LFKLRKPPHWQRLILALISRPGIQRLALGAAKLVPRILLEKTPLAPFLPHKTKRHPLSPSQGPSPARDRVALFVGCTGRSFDSTTLEAAIILLRHAGFDVEIPEGQICCGAMHHGQGDREGFEQRARANIAAFARSDKIVFIASGCGAMMAEYGNWLEEPEARQFANRLEEITSFLAREGFPERTLFAPLEGAVAIHLPCTQANVLHAPRSAEMLLKHVPGLNSFALPENHRCCGAAGTHVLTHATAANALRAPKIEALARSDAAFMVTTNVGCALHIAEGARAAGLSLEVLHPVTLLARQLRPQEAWNLAATEITL